VSQDLLARLRRVEQQIHAFKQLHESELQLILDELTDIARQVDESSAAEKPRAARADEADPAASSPKRAKWLAEHEKKAAPKSRREFLLGERGEK
jgi:hypothetical protein